MSNHPPLNEGQRTARYILPGGSQPVPAPKLTPAQQRRVNHKRNRAGYQEYQAEVAAWVALHAEAPGE